MLKSKVAYEILAYLVENPDARDTLEGILDWWLLEQTLRHKTITVKKALSELASAGLVLEKKSGDSRTHYQLNRSRYEEILELLKRRH